MTINWASFSWEALATILTGFAAVLGAFKIGIEQTKIQRAQHRLAETQVRISLFERRANCIIRMRSIEQKWHENAQLTAGEWIEFRDIFYDAELIFSKPLTLEIEEVLGSLFWSDLWLRRSQDYHSRGKNDLADQRLKESFEHDDKVFKLMPYLLGKMKNEARLVDWS